MNATTGTEIVGVVLAGGLSRRMGGGDKGLLELAGKPMLAHVIDRLEPQVGRLVINANGDPQRFAAFGLPVVADAIAGFVGPLGGILAGMRWAAANVPRARWIVTAPGDAPLVPRDLVSRLLAGLGKDGTGIALAQSCGTVHPVAGLWPVALADALAEALDKGVRKVQAWADEHGAVEVAFAPTLLCGLDLDPFFNANTPQELDQIRARLIAKRH